MSKNDKIMKNSQKIHFFLKSLSSQDYMDLDRDIWQIIFKLNVFQPTLVIFTLSLAEAAPEGGRKFWITLYFLMYFNVLYSESTLSDKISADKIFGGQNFSADKIFGTISKFRQFCPPKIFYPFYVLT